MRDPSSQMLALFFFFTKWMEKKWDIDFVIFN